MTYEGSLAAELRTAAAEAARDAETAEAFRRLVTQEGTDARSADATRFDSEEGNYLASDVRMVTGDPVNGRTFVVTADHLTHVHPFGMVYIWPDLDSFRSALDSRYQGEN